MTTTDEKIQMPGVTQLEQKVLKLISLARDEKLTDAAVYQFLLWAAMKHFRGVWSG